MKTTRMVWLICLSVTLAPSAARADKNQPAPEDVRDAVVKSLTLVQQSTATYRTERTCFSCHHQAVPVLMLTEARKRGFEIDADNFQAQLQWTAKHLERGKENYLQGKGQGGGVDTAGYALWALEAGGWQPDETTGAVAEYLLRRDGDRDHWTPTSKRPPSEASDFTTTALGLLGLAAYGTSEQAERIAARRETVRQWLAKADVHDTEDRVFRLHALHYAEAGDEDIQRAVDDLLKMQRDDGGWSQTAEMESDAYATGTVLSVLHQVGSLPVDDPAYQRGIQLLLAQQLEDGSWHIPSRSKPFQTYFESGFPHGKDQFISMAASCWATTALIFASPPSATDAAATEAQ